MKSPAFQFYADDFIGGTVMFTAEDVGAYMRLLCFQWGNGEIPERKDLVDRIAGCVVSADVMAKFPDGKNARLEQVRLKQDEYRKMQSDKGKASAKARFNHGSTTVQPEGQPNGNSPSPSPSPSPISNSGFQSPLPTSSNHEDSPASAKPKEEDGKPKSREIAIAYAREIGMTESEFDSWFDHFESNGWRVGGKTPMKNWKAALRNGKRNAPMFHKNGSHSQPVETKEEKAKKDATFLSFWEAFIDSHPIQDAAQKYRANPTGGMPLMESEFKHWKKTGSHL